MKKRTLADLIDEYTTYAEDEPPEPGLWDEADFAARDVYRDVIRDLKELT